MSFIAAFIVYDISRVYRIKSENVSLFLLSTTKKMSEIVERINTRSKEKKIIFLSLVIDDSRNYVFHFVFCFVIEIVIFIYRILFCIDRRVWNIVKLTLLYRRANTQEMYFDFHFFFLPFLALIRILNLFIYFPVLLRLINTSFDLALFLFVGIFIHSFSTPT